MGRRGGHGGPYRVGEEDDPDEDGWQPVLVTVRQQRVDAMRAQLEGDSRIRAAALIAETFKLDPVAVLDEPDVLRRLIRVAAHNVVQTEIKRAQGKGSAGK